MKTEYGINKTVYEMWNNFTASNPEFKKDELLESSYLHNDEADANRLAELVINGEKKPVLVYIFGMKNLMLIYKKSEQNLL